MAERDIKFLVVPGLPELKLPIALPPGEIREMPLLQSEREDMRDFVIMLLFALFLGAFLALAVEHLWWLA